jgi:hypothetical protein
MTAQAPPLAGRQRPAAGPKLTQPASFPPSSFSFPQHANLGSRRHFSSPPVTGRSRGWPDPGVPSPDPGSPKSDLVGASLTRPGFASSRSGAPPPAPRQWVGAAVAPFTDSMVAGHRQGIASSPLVLALVAGTSAPVASAVAAGPWCAAPLAFWPALPLPPAGPVAACAGLLVGATYRPWALLGHCHSWWSVRGCRPPLPVLF